MRCTNSIAWIVLTSIGLAGCAAKHPPLPAPLASIDRSTYSGSILTGPTTRPVASQASDATLIASIQLLALDNIPTMLNPIAPDVRLIVAARDEGAIQPRAQLTRDIRWQAGASAPQVKGRSTSFFNEQTALAPGACTVVNVADETTPSQGFRFALSPGTKVGDLDLAVSVLRKAQAEESADANTPAVLDETAVLKPITVSEPTTIAVLIPFTFAKSQVRAVLALIEMRRGTDSSEDAKLIADSHGRINQSISTAGTTQPSVAAARWTGYGVALRGLSEPTSRRASLLFVCRQTHTTICQDLALTASDQDLEAVAQAITQKLGEPNAPKDDASLSWMLDQASLSYAAGLQAKDKLPPELLAMLIRHTGQVGMNSGSVAEIIAATNTRDEFTARVISENVIYLEDASPAARVRASDWLSARGKAPAGYSPLAPPREREAALEKMYESMNAQAASHSGGHP